MKYNYRVYAATTKGYELITITKNLDKVVELSENVNFNKVLVIRHNIELNMDEPYLLTFPKYEMRLMKRRTRLK